MARFAAALLGALILSAGGFAQQPVLVSGSADGQVLYGQVPMAVQAFVGTNSTSLPLTLGGLILNSSEPLATAWLNVSTPTGVSTVAEAFSEGESQQSFSLGGGNVLFGGNVPKEWMVALSGQVADAAVPPNGGGGSGSNSGGSPILSVQVTPPSGTTDGRVSYAVTTADGDAYLYSYGVPLETDGWWILGLSPEAATIVTSDGLPIEDGYPVKNPDPQPDDRELFQSANPPPAVPEPGTLALAGFGLVCAAKRLRRK